MSKIEVRFPASDLARAQRLVRAAARELYRVTPMGTDERPLPRCEHARWRGSERYVKRLLKNNRGRVAPCTCKSVTEPDPECPHVVWPPEVERDGDELVVTLREGDLAVLVGRDVEMLVEARAGRIEAHGRKARDPDADPLPVVWSAREEMRERHRAAARETEPAPAGDRRPR